MHPWAVAILSYWLLMGVSLVVAPWVPGWVPILSLAYVDDIAGLLIGGFIAVGTVLALLSNRVWHYRTTRYTLELLGLTLLAGGWVAYVAATTAAFPSALSGWAQGIASALACLLRIGEVRRAEQITRANVRAVRNAE